jgi:hypothetical protein
VEQAAGEYHKARRQFSSFLAPRLPPFRKGPKMATLQMVQNYARMLDQYEPFAWPEPVRAPKPDHTEGEVDAEAAEYIARTAWAKAAAREMWGRPRW